MVIKNKVKSTKKASKKLIKKSTTKKVAKKTVSKKAKVKKTKKATKKIVNKKINPENYFFTVDGQILKNLIELSDAIELMAQDAYDHHVNEERNDFANWVRDVFEHEDLADKIIEIREPLRTQIVILKHIVKKGGKR